MEFGLWRLTRNPYGRRVYDALGSLGITATRMFEYVAPLDRPLPDRETPARIERGRSGDADHRHYDDLAPDERVVTARLDGREVGHVFVSVDAERRVAPLEVTRRFDGGYVRRLWVAPAHRERGIATALVAEAMAACRDAGKERARALVALDNRPSQWVFEATGFRRERAHTYVRVGPFTHRTTAPAASG